MIGLTIIVVALVCGAIGALVGNSNPRVGGGMGFLAGGILGPIGVLIVVVVLAKDKPPVTTSASPAPDHSKEIRLLERSIEDEKRRSLAPKNGHHAELKDRFSKARGHRR